MKMGVMILFFIGCRSDVNTVEKSVENEEPIDLDGDGYSEGDCDDEDPNIHPGMDEVCDGLDNNCDGDIDEGVQDVFYRDSDGDGFGDLNEVTEACESPVGYVPNGNDCDDLNVVMFPGAIEVCDGFDNDCDAAVDEEVTTTYYLDFDGDGFGNLNEVMESCEQPSGYVNNATDCDDGNRYAFPDALELCDEVDNDCDGEIDEDSSLNVLTWYQDADEDGFGDLNVSTMSCAPPTGYTDDSTDCNDGDSAIYPSAAEICDGQDNDCDAMIDDADNDTVGTTTWYLDHDGDSFGDPNLVMETCIQPSGYVSNSLDCDDLQGIVFPGALEVCDGQDNDCDAMIDDADSDTDPTTMSVFYEDVDGDGFGGAVSVSGCELPIGYSSEGNDCDDSDGAINPTASEVCDGADNNCDGLTDDSSANDAQVWYLDHDGDGFGDAIFQTVSCNQPYGYVNDDTDCDDFDGLINPSAQEVCDGVDNNCDSVMDDGDPNVDLSTGQVWYVDTDLDGFGDVTTTLVACELPSGYAEAGSDCDDGDASIYPGAAEICDGIDENCSGVPDDDPALFGSDYDCPALSCDEIHLENPTFTDGVFWIDPDGNGAVGAYCNMTLVDGGWTLVGKFTNQDGRSWANSSANWIGQNSFGSTINLNDGNDAKSELWSRLPATDFLLNDHLNLTDYVHTDDGCLDGDNLSDYFTLALASFPYSSANYYDACSVQFTNHPNWGLEPNWNNQIETSPNLGLNASGRITIAKTDGNSDTSGVISFYEATDSIEADLGLGALEDGTNFTDTGRSQDIGGPTSCGYSDTTCAVQYPETVFFWVR